MEMSPSKLIGILMHLIALGIAVFVQPKIGSGPAVAGTLFVCFGVIIQFSSDWIDNHLM